MAKRLSRITREQADQLEDHPKELIEDGTPYPGQVTKNMVKVFGIPLEVAKRAIDLVHEVRDAVEDAAEPGAERYKFEDVVNYYDALDGFLNRSLEVIDPNSKRRYKFRVGD